ncbi:MAG: porin family protein, partial [bacterium]|nr:porin family protein [bacterium]
NGSNITVNGDNYQTDAITSYHAGLIAEIKLIDSFSIQPELLYSTQGASYKNATEEFRNELGYLSIPVLAKINLNKFVSLELGPQASFLLSERNSFDVKDANTFDFAVVGGLGLNITKNLFIQGRYGLGLTDASKDAQVKNSVVQVSAGIKF